MKMPFGEHVNEEISEISTPYLKHVIAHIKITKELEDAITKELAERPANYSAENVKRRTSTPHR